jgi:hypothetical protein
MTVECDNRLTRQIRPMIEFGVTTTVWLSSARHHDGWLGRLVAYPLPPHPASFLLHGIVGLIGLFHMLIYVCVLYGVVRGFGARFEGEQAGRDQAPSGTAVGGWERGERSAPFAVAALSSRMQTGIALGELYAAHSDTARASEGFHAR